MEQLKSPQGSFHLLYFSEAVSDIVYVHCLFVSILKVYALNPPGCALTYSGHT